MHRSIPIQQWKSMVAYRIICGLKARPANLGLTATLLLSVFLCLTIMPTLASTPAKTSKVQTPASKPAQNPKLEKTPAKIAKAPALSKTATTPNDSLPALEPATDFIESTDSETTAKMSNPWANTTEPAKESDSSIPSSGQSLNGTAAKTMNPDQPVSFNQPAKPDTGTAEKPATLNQPIISPKTSTPAMPPAATTGQTVQQSSGPKATASPGQARKETPHQHGKKDHPMVIAPEPLLPASGWVAPKSVQRKTEPTEPKAVASPSAQIAQPTGNPAQLTGHATAEAKPTTPAINPSTDKTPTKATSPTSANSTVSPPQEKKATPAITRNTPAPSSQTTATAQPHHHVMERGFYPIGYTPAVRHLTPQKNLSLRQALVHYNRGVYYARHKQWDEAISEYINVINEDASMADAYVGLSTAEMQLKDWENALQYGTKALQLKQGFVDPANITQARYNLSSVYCVTNDYKKALHYFKLIKKARHPETEALWSFLQNNCHP